MNAMTPGKPRPARGGAPVPDQPPAAVRLTMDFDDDVPLDQLPDGGLDPERFHAPQARGAGGARGRRQDGDGDGDGDGDAGADAEGDAPSSLSAAAPASSAPSVQAGGRPSRAGGKAAASGAVARRAGSRRDDDGDGDADDGGDATGSVARGDAGPGVDGGAVSGRDMADDGFDTHASGTKGARGDRRLDGGTAGSRTHAGRDDGGRDDGGRDDSGRDDSGMGAGWAEAGADGGSGWHDAGPVAAGLRASAGARSRSAAGSAGRVPGRISAITVTLSVELGRQQVALGDLMASAPGQFFTLDRLTSEPVDIMVNGQLFARGEVVVVGDQFGVRLSELMDPEG